MPKITDEKVIEAQRLIAPGPQKLSIRQAAAVLEVPESSLRYRLNQITNGARTKAAGQRSGHGNTQAPIPEEDGQHLMNGLQGVGIPLIARHYDAEAHRVYPLGDVHLGSSAHQAEAWQEWREYLIAEHDRGESVSLLFTGDGLNSAIKGSKSETYDETMTVGAAMDLLGDQLEPLADRGIIDALIPGNHEERIYRAVGIEPMQVLAKRLRVPYARKVTLLRYQIGDVEYQLYMRHGTGMDGSGNAGGRINAMERAAKTVRADIYVSGHTHAQAVFRDRVFEVDPITGEGKFRRRLFLSSGSFLGYEGYAAERAFVAGDIGAPRLRLDGTRKDAHVSI